MNQQSPSLHYFPDQSTLHHESGRNSAEYENLQQATEYRLQTLWTSVHECLSQILDDDIIQTMRGNAISSQFVWERIVEMFTGIVNDDRENLIVSLAQQLTQLRAQYTEKCDALDQLQREHLSTHESWQTQLQGLMDVSRIECEPPKRHQQLLIRYELERQKANDLQLQLHQRNKDYQIIQDESCQFQDLYQRKSEELENQQLYFYQVLDFLNQRSAVQEEQLREKVTQLEQYITQTLNKIQEWIPKINVKIKQKSIQPIQSYHTDQLLQSQLIECQQSRNQLLQQLAIEQGQGKALREQMNHLAASESLLSTQCQQMKAALKLKNSQELHQQEQINSLNRQLQHANSEIEKFIAQGALAAETENDLKQQLQTCKLELEGSYRREQQQVLQLAQYQETINQFMSENETMAGRLQRSECTNQEFQKQLQINAIKTQQVQSQLRLVRKTIRSTILQKIRTLNLEVALMKQCFEDALRKERSKMIASLQEFKGSLAERQRDTEKIVCDVQQDTIVKMQLQLQCVAQQVERGQLQIESLTQQLEKEQQQKGELSKEFKKLKTDLRKIQQSPDLDDLRKTSKELFRPSTLNKENKPNETTSPYYTSIPVTEPSSFADPQKSKLVTNNILQQLMKDNSQAKPSQKKPTKQLRPVPVPVNGPPQTLSKQQDRTLQLLTEIGQHLSRQ